MSSMLLFQDKWIDRLIDRHIDWLNDWSCFLFYPPGSQTAFSQIFSSLWCPPSWGCVREFSLVFPQLRYLKWKQRQPCSHSLIFPLPAKPFPIPPSLPITVAPEVIAQWRGDEAPCWSAIQHSGMQPGVTAFKCLLKSEESLPFQARKVSQDLPYLLLRVTHSENNTAGWGGGSLPWGCDSLRNPSQMWNLHSSSLPVKYSFLFSISKGEQHEVSFELQDKIVMAHCQPRTRTVLITGQVSVI